MDGIFLGTACIVSNDTFDAESLIGSARTSAVILASYTKSDDKFYTKGFNWITGSKSDQSAYQSKLAGVIFALTILDILVCHHNITEGAVTIALEGTVAMNISQGN